MGQITKFSGQERRRRCAERTERLLAQFELEYEDLDADAAEDELDAEAAAAKTTTISAFERKKPVLKPFPDHLPRERVVASAPCSCPVCGSSRLSRLGEDVAETLEVIPRAAIAYSLIQTCPLNEVDPQALLTDVLALESVTL